MCFKFKIFAMVSRKIFTDQAKFYRSSSHDSADMISQIILMGIGMFFQRLRRLVDDEKGVTVQVRWRALEGTEDSSEPVQRIYKCISQLFMKLLQKKHALKFDRQSSPCSMPPKEMSVMHVDQCAAFFYCSVVQPVRSINAAVAFS